MARQAKSFPVAAAGRPIPHDWRSDARWRIPPMLAKIPSDEYLITARAFENDCLASGRLSADWHQEWRAYCRNILVTRGLAAGRFDEPEDEKPGLFG